MIAIIVNTLSACYNWASALFSSGGYVLPAVFATMVGIGLSFTFFRGALR